MQKITDELVEKFLSGNCTKEEAAMVWNYLRNNPDDQYLLSEYERADNGMPLPPGYREEMLDFITAKTGVGIAAAEGVGSEGGEWDGMNEADEIGDTAEKRTWGRRLRPVWHWAAAAAVILIFKSWFSLNPAMKVSGEKLAYNKVPEAGWIEKYNNGKQEMRLTLPDNSKIRLLPGAHMRYRKDFGVSAQRDVQISGKAFFEVAKNQEKPFTLYSEGLRTRVLGTSFDVNANPYSDKIKIKLYTGKVLVSLEGEVRADVQKDYYLAPGQELVFSKSTRNVAINDPAKHIDEHTAKMRPMKPDTISNWYMFNNQTLADVFDQLAAIYNVDIDYSREDIRNMYFIGKLEKKDSLIEIIHDIALLNHLSVTSLNGRYIIKKGKP